MKDRVTHECLLKTLNQFGVECEKLTWSKHESLTSAPAVARTIITLIAPNHRFTTVMVEDNKHQYEPEVVEGILLNLDIPKTAFLRALRKVNAEQVSTPDGRKNAAGEKQAA